MPATSTLKPTKAHPPIDLDARLALADVAMSLRLDRAAVAFEVNTAHIPVEPALVPDRPLPAAPAAMSTPYPTPIAGCLQRAHHRLTTRGWCTGRLADEQGALCLIGAIRAEARTPGEASAASAFLLGAIQATDPHAETVPSWNDRQHSTRTPLRMLDRAAQAADARDI